jgi:hypothetical protein
VDYLEKPARDYLSKYLAAKRAGSPPTCQVGGSDLADCVLPFLPFTTINLTEIASWAASSNTILDVNTQHALGTDPTQPSGGRTRGIAVGQADTTATMRTSNSGVAATTAISGATDMLGDEATVNDSQMFDVGGNGNTGDKFTVVVTGGGLDPKAFYAIPANSDTGECTKQSAGNLRCTTGSTLPGDGTLKLANYNSETTASASISANCTSAGACTVGTITCTVLKNNPPTSITSTVNNKPVFNNYQISSALIGPGAGVILPASNAPADGTSDNTAVETTTLTFTGLTANSQINLGLTFQGQRTDSTVASCTVSKTGSTWYVQIDSWNKLW